jgi:hypothetical protein
MLIPNIVHFIYAGGRSFSFIHLLAIYTAWKVNNPDAMLMHCTDEPKGPFWDRAKEFVEVNFVAPVTQVYGNPVKHPAHQADVIRLNVLRELGGIYLDLDVVCINPFTPLLGHEVVMGLELGSGLCNAVILARPGAPFIARWQDGYHDFEGRLWNAHSVILPWKLALAFPSEIHVEDHYSFFYPGHDDPVQAYLWGKRPSFPSVAHRVARNLIRMIQLHVKRDRNPMSSAEYKCFHVLRGRAWHYGRVDRAYSIHLWETQWRQRYLANVDTNYLRKATSNFAKVMRRVLTDVDIERLS